MFKSSSRWMPFRFLSIFLIFLAFSLALIVLYADKSATPFRHGVCYFQVKSPDILPIAPCVHLSRVEEIPLHAHICPCFCSIKHNEIFPLPYSVILDILFSGAVPLVVLDVLIEACSSTAVARLFLFFPKYIAENLVLFISAFSLE